MNAPTYTLGILRLASESASLTRLAKPDVSSSKRSPLCGSSATIDLKLKNGIVAAVGGQVRACAFGQASALIFARSAAGLDLARIERARGTIAAWLHDAEAPLPDWPGIEVLAPARRKSARHAAILLPFDAALAALNEAKAAA